MCAFPFCSLCAFCFSLKEMYKACKCIVEKATCTAVSVFIYNYYYYYLQGQKHVLLEGQTREKVIKDIGCTIKHREKAGV